MIRSEIIKPDGGREKMEINDLMKNGVLDVSRRFNQHGRTEALVGIRDLQENVIRPNIEDVIQTAAGRIFIRDLARLEDALDEGNVAPERFVELSIGFCHLINDRKTK
jgi:hypothetical protein